MIVPMPCASAIVALTASERLTSEGLVDLVERVAADRHGDVFGVWPGGEGQRAGSSAA